MKEKDPQTCLKSLGCEIRAHRERQGLSQEKLAMMINSGQSYIYRVESGRIKLGIDKVIRIANALDVDVADLIKF